MAALEPQASDEVINMLGLHGVGVDFVAHPETGSVFLVCNTKGVEPDRINGIADEHGMYAEAETPAGLLRIVRLASEEPQTPCQSERLHKQAGEFCAETTKTFLQ